MNPTFVGRVELPDNLKSLLRPISMVKPNQMLIAEIILYSLGFKNAKDLG
jgi:dynein heavy chain